MDEARTNRFVGRMVALNLVALVAGYMGGQWDAAEHAKGAVDTFWYPPHYGIYLAIFAAAALSIAGLIVLLRTPGPSWRTKIRGNGLLLVLVVANTLGFTGAPLDAWWHLTFGIDLTVWSPPHIHLLAGMVLAALACAVYFAANIREDEQFTTLRGSGWIAVLALAIAILLAAYLFFEYEAGLANADVRARPSWTYPVLWTAFSVFAIALSRSLLRMPWAATVVATIYCGARVAVLGIDRTVLDFAGAVPYPLIIPAIVFDVVLPLANRRVTDAKIALGVAGGTATVSVILTAPVFWSAAGILPDLNVAPWTSAWPAALVTGLLGGVLGWWCGQRLRRLRPGPSGTTPASAPSSTAESVP